MNEISSIDLTNVTGGADPMACKDDYFAYCKDHPFNDRAGIKECLLRNKGHLQAACAANLK